MVVSRPDFTEFPRYATYYMVENVYPEGFQCERTTKNPRISRTVERIDII